MNKQILLFLLISIILSSGIYTLDAMPVTIASGYDNVDWNNLDQNITLSCTDTNSDFNCASIAYKIGDANYVTTLNDANAPTFEISFIISTDGNHQVDFNATSTDGNIEDTNTIYVLIDKIAPVTTIVGNSALTKINQNITLTCVDNNSGCDSIKYSIDNDTNFVDYNSDLNIVIDTDGNKALRYYSTDNATNDENVQLVYVSRDTNAPIVEIDSFSSITETGAKINVTVSELSTCRYKKNSTDEYDHMDDTKEESGTSTLHFDITGLTEDTTYTYYIACTDVAGNESEIVDDHFTTDASSPSDSSSSDDDEDAPVVIPVTVTGSTAPFSNITLAKIETTLRQNNVDLNGKVILISNDEIEVKRNTRGTVTDGRGNYTFTINVKNKTNKDRNITIIEIIPKNLASLVSKITFTTQPTKIINADPIVMWEIKVDANKDVNLSYRINNVSDTNVTKNTIFIKNWANPVALVKKEIVIATPTTQVIPVNTDINCTDDNDDCTQEVIENGVCILKNICEISPMNAEITLKPKTTFGKPNLLWLLIIGSIFAIAMMGVGISEISKNSNSMGYGFKHHMQSMFSLNKRRRR